MVVDVYDGAIRSHERCGTWQGQTAGWREMLRRNRSGGRPTELLAPTAAAGVQRPGQAHGQEERWSLMCTTALSGRVGATGRGRERPLAGARCFPELGREEGCPNDDARKQSTHGDCTQQSAGTTTCVRGTGPERMTLSSRSGGVRREAQEERYAQTPPQRYRPA